MPHVADFREYCSTHLKHKNVAMRPKLSAVLLHPYFNHEFVVIHSFLSELPLKNQQDKQQFFTSLIDRLREFDEENVAILMSDLLLSRIVLLDATAQLCVTPFVLKPRTDDMYPALFNSQTFTKYILPKILQIFSVRDAQIRLILLEYFAAYMRLFSVDDLKDQLLPQLLLGIKDTNDVLVAATLRCLADLVPVLGAAIVVGRNRGRLFADGRPQGLPDVSNHWIEHRSITPVMNATELVSGSPLLDHVDISASYESPHKNHLMPERLSPDGGEDVKTTSEVLELEDDAWSDWETEPDAMHLDDASATNNIITGNTPSAVDVALENNNGTTSIIDLSKKQSTVKSENFIKDIKELEIKPAASSEIDFFKDMEPIIQKTNVLVIEEERSRDERDGLAAATGDIEGILGEKKVCTDDNATMSEKGNKIQEDKINVDQSRFEIKTSVSDSAEETGWDDEANDWDDDG